jgi:integrase
MPRPPKPWWWAARGEWAVTIDGRRHRLGPDAGAATAQFHALMASRSRPAPAPHSVAALADDFLEHVRRHRAPRTFRWYTDQWQSFLDATGIANLAAADVRPSHIESWLDANPHWSAATRDGAITAITAAFRWGVKLGHLARNPVAHVERPRVENRDKLVPLSHYTRILEIARPPFRDLVCLAWETGARPQELCTVESRHVSLAQGIWTFKLAESKGQRHPRVVYLSDEALEITKRLTEQHPSGPLLRNNRGRPWNGTSTCGTFRRLAKHLDGELYCLYNFRHTFATRMLLADVDSVTLASIMGHRDTTMLSRVYAHLESSPEQLRSILAGAAARLGSVAEPAAAAVPDAEPSAPE